MSNALWNVNDSLSTTELVARIKASVRQHQDKCGCAAEGTEPTESAATEWQNEDAAASIQAEVNQTLLRSLDLVVHHLEQLQTHVGLVDEWVREETEQSAEFHHEVSKQLSQLSRLIVDLNARLTALEEHSEERKATRMLGWPRLAAISRWQGRG